MKNKEEITRFLDNTCEIIINKANELDSISLGELAGNEIGSNVAIYKTNKEVEYPGTIEEWEDYSKIQQKNRRNMIIEFETKVGMRKEISVNDRIKIAKEAIKKHTNMKDKEIELLTKRGFCKGALHLLFWHSKYDID